MNFDLKSGPCAIIALQEAGHELLAHLRQPGVEGVPAESGDATRGGGVNYVTRPTCQYIGIRGQEKGKSLLIAARKSIVQAMRLCLFRLRADGTFKAKKKKGGGSSNRKVATTRILIVSCHMRFFKFPLCEDIDQEELVVVNVHLHYMTAKKEVSNGAEALSKFWDELAAYLVEFRGRILAGDFNMALWLVIPELRLRGLQVNLAAWYPWRAPFETTTRIDSTAIFIVGPVNGIRKCFDASALGIIPAQPSAADLRGGGSMPAGWQLVDQVVKGPAGVEERRPAPVPDSPIIGQGYPLSSYRPVHARIRSFVGWAFEPALEFSAVAEVAEAWKHDKDMFPTKPDDTQKGWPTWSLPTMPGIKQKLITKMQFDPENELFKRGAHMPLMIFVGNNCDTRRTPEAHARRGAAAAKRGWGKGKGKGKSGETDSGARGSGRWTGSDSWARNSWTEGGDEWARWTPQTNRQEM